MKIKRILSEAKLVIADLEVDLNGTLRNCPTLCAAIANADGSPDTIVPLNTPDGRPILLNMENAIKP
jgi:hypothetical protein